MARRVNCGNYWTLISVECWLRENCKSCPYTRYCEENKRCGTPIIKIVIKELLLRFGKPPRKLIISAREQQKNPILIVNLKKNVF